MSIGMRKIQENKITMNSQDFTKFEYCKYQFNGINCITCRAFQRNKIKA